MATADQLKALVKSHAEGDDTKFYSVALQVAAKAARSGQSHYAQELRDLIDAARKEARSSVKQPVPVTRPRGDLAELLSVVYPSTRMADLVLEPVVREKLERVIVEQRQQEQLQARGFRPSRKLLLVGPPGTGKTMSAGALAGELRIPLFTIRLDGLITKFMGETAAKLRVVFDAMQQTRGVYLFDEVDALGGERARANDVGEIRRVLNSFLQFLEQDESDSILISATNHPQLLDYAIFRRFDTVVQFPLPNSEVVRDLIRNRLSAFRLGRVAWSRLYEAANGLSHADVTLAAERAAKEAILRGEDQVSANALVEALKERHSRAQP